jgi:hypothetical protein
MSVGDMVEDSSPSSKEELVRRKLSSIGLLRRD